MPVREQRTKFKHDVLVEGNLKVTGSILGDVTGDVTGDITGEALATAASTEHGTGALGTGVAPTTSRRVENGTIIKEVKLDLTGLKSKNTANDIIGADSIETVPAYIGRYVTATDGIIYKVELICLETPAGGDDDINVVELASDTAEYDGAGGTDYLVNGGNALAGAMVANLAPKLTANEYWYLAAGTGDTANNYTAGQFILRTYGHALITA